MSKTALYIHYPFCLHKCPYCDFNSHVHQSISNDEWGDKIISELEQYRALYGHRTISSIFFGGGTPSLLPANLVGRIIDASARIFAHTKDIEITAEANSGAIDYDKFRDFRTAGINRLSLGVQALNDKDLRFLGRIHDAKTAMNAMDNAATIFENWSCDLIYARPSQTIKQWLQECQTALTFKPNHISLYQLTIEQGTDFHRQHRLGKLQLPSIHKQTRLFTLTREFLANNAMPDYEISNHARIGYESRHNVTYWQSGEWFGCGPGAHSRINHDGQRLARDNERLPLKWYQKTDSETIQILSEDEIFQEYLLMGLRLSAGIAAPTQYPAHLPDKYAVLVKKKLAHYGFAHLKLTDAGFLRCNAVIEFLID